MLRQVAGATYHQVWWLPLTNEYTPDRPSAWDEHAAAFVDPDNGVPLHTGTRPWTWSMPTFSEDDKGGEGCGCGCAEGSMR